MNYTYMLRCADDSLYTGWTADMGRRLQQHQRGVGGKYTRSRLPVSLLYCEKHEDRQQAMSREAQIKHLTRKQKIELIRSKEAERSERTEVK